jgi:hypothetical protein
MLLHLVLADLFRFDPIDNQDKFTTLYPLRENLSMGTPWIPISSEIECWEEKNKIKKEIKNFYSNLTYIFQNLSIGFF